LGKISVDPTFFESTSFIDYRFIPYHGKGFISFISREIFGRASLANPRDFQKLEMALLYILCSCAYIKGIFGWVNTLVGNISVKE
jgi:hypothetical protein